MIPVELKSVRLQTLLSNITNIFYTGQIRDISQSIRDPKPDELMPDLHPTSKEYLERAFTLPLREFGFPRRQKGFGMAESTCPPQYYEVTQTVRKMSGRIGEFLGTPIQALIMSYPDNGWMGWHHNGNAHGYNILLSYSQDGDGVFKFYDYEKQEISFLQDNPGWNARVGYFPDQRKEPKRVYWHSVDTAKQRVTLAWVLNHKSMWLSMINEITNGEYDKERIENQGPLR